MARRLQFEFTEYRSYDGAVYHFDTGDKFLVSETGEGMPPIGYITQRGPFQHGETVFDYRLEPRIIQLIHRRNACSRQEYWENRATLLDMLRPNRHATGAFATGALYKTLTDGSQRAIDVMIEQGPMFQPSDPKKWDEWSITETLRFIAHDPTWFDPDINTEIWVLNPDTVNQLLFPFTFDGTDMAFRQYTMSDDHIITYTGTWLSYPNIVITGPLIRPRIQNLSTDELIDLDYTVESGEVVTIDLSYGNKSVESDIHDNITGAVQSTSDLATFHIAPAPEVADGANTINVAGGGATGTTDVRLTYYTRYIGI